MHQTSLILIENNDCKIWHRDRVLLDLIQKALKGDPFVVSLNAEGPCAESLGIYKLLDDICYRTGLSKNKITITTCNLLEKHNEYDIKISFPAKHILKLQQLIIKNSVAVKNVEDIKKHFGHFVGHSSRHRLAIASWLFKQYQDKTFQTFHSSPTNEFHREFVSLEDLWFHNYDLEHIDNAIEFLKNVPLKYDPVEDGPILDMKMYGILGAYADIFLDIVCNTYVTGNTFYLDEKIWRPIITKTPFIVHGPRNFIHNFKKLGFQTFDRWWNEGYSEDSPDCQTKCILEIIDQISKYSLADLRDLYNQMKPVLDHNHEVFMTMDRSFYRRILAHA